LAHRAADFFRRERHQLPGHRRGDRGHADPDRAITDLGEPGVILHVVQQVIRQIASANRWHNQDLLVDRSSLLSLLLR
jgi:hypothetical protein